MANQGECAHAYNEPGIHGSEKDMDADTGDESASEDDLKLTYALDFAAIASMLAKACGSLKRARQRITKRDKQLRERYAMLNSIENLYEMLVVQGEDRNVNAITKSLMNLAPWLMQDLQPASRKRVAMHVQLKLYKHGDLVFREGDRPTGYFVILNGSVGIYKQLQARLFQGDEDSEDADDNSQPSVDDRGDDQSGEDGYGSAQLLRSADAKNHVANTDVDKERAGVSVDASHKVNHGEELSKALADEEKAHYHHTKQHGSRRHYANEKERVDDLGPQIARLKGGQSFGSLAFSRNGKDLKRTASVVAEYEPADIDLQLSALAHKQRSPSSRQIVLLRRRSEDGAPPSSEVPLPARHTSQRTASRPSRSSLRSSFSVARGHKAQYAKLDPRWSCAMLLVPNKIYVTDISKTVDATLQRKIALLENSLLFETWEVDELHPLAHEITFSTVSEEEPVCQEGDPSTHLIIVVSGELRVSMAVPTDALTTHSIDVALLPAGEMFGLVESYRRIGHFRASVTAIKRSEVALLPQNTFRRAVMSDEASVKIVSRIAANRERWEGVRRDTIAQFKESPPITVTLEMTATALYLIEPASILEGTELREYELNYAKFIALAKFAHDYSREAANRWKNGRALETRYCLERGKSMTNSAIDIAKRLRTNYGNSNRVKIVVDKLIERRDRIREHLYALGRFEAKTRCHQKQASALAPNGAPAHSSANFSANGRCRLDMGTSEFSDDGDKVDLDDDETADSFNAAALAPKLKRRVGSCKADSSFKSSPKSGAMAHMTWAQKFACLKLQDPEESKRVSDGYAALAGNERQRVSMERRLAMASIITGTDINDSITAADPALSKLRKTARQLEILLQEANTIGSDGIPSVNLLAQRAWRRCPGRFLEKKRPSKAGLDASSEPLPAIVTSPLDKSDVQHSLSMAVGEKLRHERVGAPAVACEQSERCICRYSCASSAATFLAASLDVESLPVVTVVAADDSVRRFLRLAFENFGCIVHEDRRGSKALDRLRRFQLADRPRVIAIFGFMLAKGLRGLTAAIRHRQWEDTMKCERAVEISRNRRSKLAVLVDASASTERKQSDASKANAHGVLLLPENCTVLDLVRIACDGDEGRLKVAIKKHNSLQRSRSRSRHSSAGLNRASIVRSQHYTLAQTSTYSASPAPGIAPGLSMVMDSLQRNE